MEIIDKGKVKNGIKLPDTIDDQKPEFLIKDAIFVRHEGSLVKVKFNEMLWMKGEGNYTNIVLKTGTLIVRNILKDFEKSLPSDQFVRIHKSYIVRIDEINSINMKEVIVGKDPVPVGRTYYQMLLNGIQKLGSGSE
ncbi:LytR/AlgR family response regulator transcription factor [Algoriphagus pacificus]|uniref:LytTR family transcriptional regulator n=1 Tax=Algoriphagus pacificus TaxID=2811234 RepID=A0ABS3CKJ5_9BACT|nr:LytTR family DNA-binding domain-containing protein [Algoriphagus pacificus]MBN7817633.1 LytTR family transcriptional regulator [Algoriphagus pacificus]